MAAGSASTAADRALPQHRSPRVRLPEEKAEGERAGMHSSMPLPAVSSLPSSRDSEPRSLSWARDGAQGEVSWAQDGAQGGSVSAADNVAAGQSTEASLGDTPAHWPATPQRFPKKLEEPGLHTVGELAYLQFEVSETAAAVEMGAANGQEAEGGMSASDQVQTAAASLSHARGPGRGGWASASPPPRRPLEVRGGSEGAGVPPPLRSFSTTATGNSQPPANSRRRGIFSSGPGDGGGRAGPAGGAPWFIAQRAGRPPVSGSDLSAEVIDSTPHTARDDGHLSSPARSGGTGGSVDATALSDSCGGDRSAGAGAGDDGAGFAGASGAGTLAAMKVGRKLAGAGCDAGSGRSDRARR
jgi:hypothetical protein